MKRTVRILTLGLLLMAAPALAQTTPAPVTDPAAPPAPTDTTAPAPATPDQTAPATDTATPAAPAAAPTTAQTPAQTVTLPTLTGTAPLRTVSTVLGQAAIYSGTATDVLAQTLTALQAQGYTAASGDAASGSVTVTLSGQTYLLRTTPYLGLTVLSLSQVPQRTSASTGTAPAAAPATDTTAPATDTATPATDPAAPATDTAVPADTTAPTDTTAPAPTDPAAPTPPPTAP
ncbi:hypothetical protein [Deinococcus altitudinis]|uniref:hypothetical protein n=1 Tax=Deinococcus altitudinis TaxID=468914 RepID=UPI003891E92A